MFVTPGIIKMISLKDAVYANPHAKHAVLRELIVIVAHVILLLISKLSKKEIMEEEVNARQVVIIFIT